MLAFRDAVRIAALRRGPDGVRRLDRAVQELWELAAQGNVAALKLVGDSLDGRVRAANPAEENPQSFVVRMP